MVGQFISGLILLLVFAPRVMAVLDPLAVPNNRWGIHIADPNDVPDVPALVNSNGGDWGYVTLVITEAERDTEKWQTIFNQMRRLHLIPLVRLATKLDGASWVRPAPETLDIWVSFLSSLNWPVVNRYVIAFNEPNHAKEWGNVIDPEGYAEVLSDLAQKLKAVSDDFFILPAGLDASAGSDTVSLDEATYLARMLAAKPEILSLMDGWTSHSYPNPDFSGSTLAYGKGTLRTYQWELAYLKALGLSKNLPVFITETGWMHNQGKAFEPKLLPPQVVAENIRQAVTTVWNDPRIAAVTPFVFSYQDIPFDHFSWKALGKNQWYAQYYVYQEIAKTKGQPRQRQQYNMLWPLLPQTLVAGSRYHLQTEVKNVGQGILSPAEYSLKLESNRGDFALTGQELPAIEPEQTGKLTISLITPAMTGTYRLNLTLQHAGQSILLESHTLDIIPQPALAISTKLGWKTRSDSSDASVLIYDADQQLIHKFTGRPLSNGLVQITNLTDIIPGRAYRVVLLVPNYLPRQATLRISSGTNTLALKRLLPFDLNRDGTLTLSDLGSLFKLNPAFVYQLFLGN